MEKLRGSWIQIGETGSWIGIQSVATSNNEIISIDSLGDLWATNPETGKSRYVNKDKYTSSMFLLGTKNELFSIDRDGTLWITNTINGSYRQVGEFASYAHTIRAVMCGNNLISIEKSGSCYITYPNGEFKKINEDNFSNIQFIFSGEKMFYIIENNTLYSVNPETGKYVKLGGDGDYSNTKTGTGFNDKIVILETFGYLWEIDGISGAYSKISEETYLDTKMMIGSDNFLYTIEPTGCLYQIAL
jgi:hypothetical protein